MPVLVIAGRHDGAAASEGLRDLTGLLPNGRYLEYERSGHFAYLDEPEHFARDVTAFLVRPFPETGTAKWQVSTAGGSQPTWAGSGRELFYVNGKNEMVSAAVRPGAVFSVGEQRVLFSTAPFAGGGGIHAYSVSPDDRKFVAMREAEAAQQSERVLAENWLQELRAPAPK